MTWTNGETGTIQSDGRDNHVPFEYGTSDCTNGTHGTFESRVLITGGGGPSFTLPVVTTHYFNSTCSGGRGSCSGAASFCP